MSHTVLSQARPLVTAPSPTDTGLRAQLRLGFHYHVPACRGADGRLYTPGHLGRFLDSLAAQCERLVLFLHSPRPSEMAQMDYALEATNVEWIDMGVRESTVKRNLTARRLLQPFRAAKPSLDALLLRGPSPLLPAFARAAGELPVALLIVGDYMTGIDSSAQPGWRKALVRLWSAWNKRQQLSAAHKALTFVNSRKLYDELKPAVPHLLETRTTTLSASDFYVREPRPLVPPYHLLYTGRLAREKGLTHLVQAVALLAARGIDVVLDLVGWAEAGDPILDELTALAQQHGISERVIHHGRKAVGEELFAFYKQADLYVLASYAEGFPRTIWEAMAHSLPVIATRVGSIPAYLEPCDCALLIEPYNADAIADAVCALIEDPERRAAFVRRGLALARENTLEKRAGEMMAAIRSWVREKAAHGG